MRDIGYLTTVCLAPSLSVQLVGGDDSLLLCCAASIGCSRSKQREQRGEGVAGFWLSDDRLLGAEPECAVSWVADFSAAYDPGDNLGWRLLLTWVVDLFPRGGFLFGQKAFFVCIGERKESVATVNGKNFLNHKVSPLLCYRFRLLVCYMSDYVWILTNCSFLFCPSVRSG